MRRLFFALALSFTLAVPAFAQHRQADKKSAPQQVIFDTDIGDDIDDAYALALLLKSPEVKILGITTAFGDTHLRARLVSRLLEVTGNTAIPVYEGPKTTVAKGLTQTAFALQSPDRPYPNAIAFTLDAVRKHPGQITLVAVAPLTNIGALIAKDPATFRKLRRVVLMGGSVGRGYGNAAHADREWNILGDIAASKALFASGVPLYVMPLDSTQILLDKSRRESIFVRDSPLTNALRELTKEWTAATTYDTPTLFDVVATAYALDPKVCPMTPMRIEVDDKGFTRKVDGEANANVCLASTAENFFAFYLPRVTR